MPLFFDTMKFPTTAAYMAEVVEAGCFSGSMVVVVLADDEQRGSLLRQEATDSGGVYLTCERWTTPKRFIAAMAGALGLSENGTAGEIKRRIFVALDDNPRPLFFDHAERLRPRMFGSIRSIHDQASVLIVMAGATTKLIDLTDDRQQGGQFFSRRIRRDIDAAMLEDRQSACQTQDGTDVIGRIGPDQCGEDPG